MSENSIERLHIKELKKRFNSNKTISVDDFYIFYNEIYGDIKKSTVRWYLYVLKQQKIIKNVSRGIYAFEEKGVNFNAEYIVITMDIVHSSDIEYITFNRKLKDKVKILNEAIYNKYEYDRRFYISQGDEIQILCPVDERLSSLIMITLAYLRPFRVRYGISFGSFAGELFDNSWEMNGPIFWNARDILTKFKNSKEYDGTVIGEYDTANKLCSRLLSLINISINRITDKQWDTIKYELSYYSLSESLDELKISKTSYYERISTSNLNEILDSFSAILDIMKLRGRLN